MRTAVSEYVVRRLGQGGLTCAWPLFSLLADKGPLDQLEAATQLGMTRGTSSLYAHALEGAGLIHRSRIERGRVGRPRVIWDIDRENNWLFVTVAMVPQLMSFLINLDGVPIAEWTEDLAVLDSTSKVRGVLERMLKESARLAKRRGARLRLAVGAWPGRLDEKTGAVVFSENVPALNGLDFEGLAERVLGLPALSSYLGLVFFYGETERLDPREEALIVYMDLGIGAVIGQGSVPITLCPHEHPARPSSPGLGHVRMARDGRTCHCGGKGCLEAYASGSALIERLGLTDRFNIQELIQRVRQGDSKAMAAAREAMETLGRAITWPVCAFGIDRIILTGRLAPLVPQVRDALLAGMGQLMSDEEISRLQLTITMDPVQTVRRGGFLLARQAFSHPTQFDRPMAEESERGQLFSSRLLRYCWSNIKVVPD